MKRKKILILLLLLCLLLCALIPLALRATHRPEPKPSTPSSPSAPSSASSPSASGVPTDAIIYYNYPDSYTSPEMLKIPQDILARMTDEALVGAIAEYPYLTRLHDAGTGMSEKIEAAREYFSALDALMRRDTCETALRTFGIPIADQYRNAINPQTGVVDPRAARIAETLDALIDTLAPDYSAMSDEALLRRACESGCFDRWQPDHGSYSSLVILGESCPALAQLLSRETAPQCFRNHGPSLISEYGDSATALALQDIVDRIFGPDSENAG